MYNYEHVLGMLSARSSVLDFTGKEERVKNLCAFACVETGNDQYWAKVEDEAISFSNSLLEMPEDTIIMKRVRSMTGKPIRYRAESQVNIRVLDYGSGTLLVDYWAVPYAEDGNPPITQLQLGYCVAVAEYYLMRDAWMEDKISRIDLDLFKQEMDKAKKRAIRRRTSIDDIERMSWVMRKGIFYPNADVLKTI